LLTSGVGDVLLMGQMHQSSTLNRLLYASQRLCFDVSEMGFCCVTCTACLWH